MTTKKAKTETPPWEKKPPAKKPTKLGAAAKKSAKASAKSHGRPYPNLVDNMAAAKKDRKK